MVKGMAPVQPKGEKQLNSVKVGVEARSGRCFKMERENFLKRRRFHIGEQEPG